MTQLDSIKPIVMMYAYFDRNNDIKAITPHLDDALSETLSTATFMLSEVEMFLTGKTSPADFTVQSIKKSGKERFVLVEKVKKIEYTRSLDNYLTRIDELNHDEDLAVITIVNNLNDRVISVNLGTSFVAQYNKGSDEYTRMLDEFLCAQPSPVYITKKNDPYSLVYSFDISPKELFDSKVPLYYNYDIACVSTSAYTKKLIDGYSYKEIV